MSGVRLVRCPKCDKVLPEPSDCPVYQCGGCGVILRAKKKLSVSDGLLDGSSGELRLVSSSDSVSDKGPAVVEGGLDMDNGSPARSMLGDENGVGLTEFQGGLPKSPMRDRFLDDLSKTPLGGRNVSSSPFRERGGADDFDGISSPSARSRNVSKSPIRGRGGTPVSTRTKDVSMSPRREGAGLGAWDGGIDGSPSRTVNGLNGDIPKSPLRGDLGSDREGIGEREKLRKMAEKTSFGDWLPEDEQGVQSNNEFPDRRRRTWRDRIENRPDKISEGVESIYSDEHSLTSEGPIDGHNPRISHRNGVYKGDNFGGYARQRANADQWGHDRDVVGELGVSYGTSKVVIEEGRVSASSSAIHGYSNYRIDPINGYGNPRQSIERSRGPARVKNIQQQRLELLRKKKELEDQLLGLEGNGVSTAAFYGSPDDFSEDGFSTSRGRPRQQFAGDNNALGSNFGSGQAQYMANMYDSSDPLYDVPYVDQMRRRHHPNQQKVPGYVPGRSLDFDQDPYGRVGTHGHHLACTCSLCFANGMQDRNLPHGLARRSGNLVDNPGSHHSMNLDRHGPRVYDPRMAFTDPRLRQQHPGEHHPRRFEVAGLNKRLCRPISGGAPFVICHGCFQLLKLPSKFTRKQKDLHLLQCGACSVVISFDLQHCSVGQLSSPQESDAVLSSLKGESDAFDAAEVFSVPKNESGAKHRRDSLAATSTNVGSYDFEAEGYSFQSMGSEISTVSKGQKFSPPLAEKRWEVSSSPSHVLRDERNSDSGSIRSSQPNSTEMPPKIRPPPGSPLRDHLDYSSQFKMSQAELAAEWKQVLEQDASPEGPLDIIDANDSEFPVNESQGYGNTSKESPVAGENRRARPSVLNMLGIGKSGANSPVRADVYVNGQAIAHHLVIKAEKLAGPIEPGNYWYDPKAGFWGVMGHRCLGIIPPFIQEFSLPIPANCCGGDTAVYVNGRELNRRDMDLLAGRGLPTVMDKKYSIDISGKVLDEDTRDFVVNLGRLAPSVEKNKCGFGMHVPEKFDE